MKLKEIYNSLLSEGRTQAIQEDKAKNIFKENINSAWSRENTNIFRGVSDFEGKYGFV